MNIKKLFIALLFCLLPGSVAAQESWAIDNFSSTIAIQEDGTVDITETIQVDFRAQGKHGIFRDIPIAYQDENGDSTYTRIEDITVIQDSVPATIDIENNQSNLRIKIGDANREISGKHQYIIRYTAVGVLRSVPAESGDPIFDELYWNVTGNNWEVPINHSEAIISLAKQSERVQTSCYQGNLGSTDSCIATVVNERSHRFTASRPLNPGEGLTAALGYDHGLIPLLTVEPPKTVWDAMLSTSTLISFLAVLIGGIFGITRLWMKKGRDDWHHKGDEKTMPIMAQETIVAEYESPAKLRPAEIGVLMDERADTLDVSATIVDLAVHGYLTITEVPKKWLFGSTDYTLKRTTKAADALLEYEKSLLSALFKDPQSSSVQLSTLKETFYDDLAQVKKLLYEEVMRKKLFRDNPETTRTKYIVGGIVAMVLGGLLFFGGTIVLSSTSLGTGVGLAILGVVMIIVAFAMPARTAHGRELYRQARGYELFINTAEKYRSRFAEKESLFTEILPYAIVFGATKQLAKAMEKLGIQPVQPTWYYGLHPFNSVAFAQDINGFSQTLSTAMAATPGSSGSGGGGFSGGGFGGGGGGSW